MSFIVFLNFPAAKIYKFACARDIIVIFVVKRR